MIKFELTKFFKLFNPPPTVINTAHFPHVAIMCRVSKTAAKGRKFCNCALQRVASAAAVVAAAAAVALAAAVVAIIFALLPQLFFCELCSWHLNELVPGGRHEGRQVGVCANRRAPCSECN